MTNNPQNMNQVLQAVQLGWLSVEAFGRLRRWARTGRGPSGSKGDAKKRFNFSDRKLNLMEELLIALDQLKATSALLTPDIAPPIPDDPGELLQRAKKDIDAVWLEFEDWSRKVWNALQVVNPPAGLAFTYGGSLADTYWFAYENPDQLGALLRSYRLENIASYFDSIAEDMPPYVAEVIHYSLFKWRIGDQLKNVEKDREKRLLERLKAQDKVWRDVLFGLQRPDHYLLEKDRRRIAWGAFGATALLVVLVGLAVWLAVLLLAGAGRALLASVSGVNNVLVLDSSQMVEKLLNYQNWSSLLATLSSVVVLLTGSITRLSGWIVNFHARAREWLTLRSIYSRTYRD